MIICIEGPTGSGKSNLAIELALAIDAEIISSDSRQVYIGMDIGTAKVNQIEQAKVKHHLIDIINPDSSYNAGAFVKEAQKIIADDKNVIICGGTGLYIQSLLYGLFEHPPIDPTIRTELKVKYANSGIAPLYELLKQIDPAVANRLSENDPQRILRALEIYIGTGITLSQHWESQNRDLRYKTYRILVQRDREELYQRINHRLSEMIEQGLLQEIEGLLKQGYTWDSPGLNSLGYKEFRPYFEDGISMVACSHLAAQHHRNYAKRQLTWYRKITFDLTLHPSQVNLSSVLRAILPE